MPHIIMYTSPICPYCVRAKNLLIKKGVSDREIEEIDISVDPSIRDKMIEITGGRRTVPQIFIDDLHIGGCDDLYALNAAGGLDALLGLGEKAG